MSSSDILTALPSVAGHLEADEARVLSLLLEKLRARSPRNSLRSAYFDGESRLNKMGLSLPPEMRNLEAVVGWPAKAVNTLEHRLDLEGFVLTDGASSDDTLTELSDANHLQVKASEAHTASLVHGTSFVVVTPGGPGEAAAVVTPCSAREATALWSRRLERITAGLVVTEASDGEPASLTMFTDDRVLTVRVEGRDTYVHRVPHSLGRVPMVALSHRPWIERQFGVSRISRPVMSMTDQAVRSILRSEAHAEFLSFPQRFIMGASKGAFDAGTGETLTGWELYLGRLNGIERDREGNLPELEEFSPVSSQVHTEQLRSIAMMFSGETSIPPSFLGIIQDNPASADAIRAAESDLVKIAERDQVMFGRAWCEVARLAVQIATGSQPDHLSGLKARWKDAATPTKAANAQSVMTLVSAGVLPPRSEVTYELLGYDDAMIRRLMADVARMDAVDQLARMTDSEQPGEGSLRSGVASMGRGSAFRGSLSRGDRNAVGSEFNW